MALLRTGAGVTMSESPECPQRIETVRRSKRSLPNVTRAVRARTQMPYCSTELGRDERGPTGIGPRPTEATDAPPGQPASINPLKEAFMSRITPTPSAAQAAIIKGMLRRGDRQQYIVAWFGGVFNPGRVSAIKTGRKFADVVPAPETELPPPGPYKTH